VKFVGSKNPVIEIMEIKSMLKPFLGFVELTIKPRKGIHNTKKM